MSCFLKINPEHIQSHGRWYLNLTVVLYKFTALLNPFLNVPTTYVVKHTDITESKAKSLIFRFIDEMFTKVLFPSHYFMKKCITSVGYNPSKCCVVYPGVPSLVGPGPDLFDLEVDGRKVITYVGKFVLPGKVRGLFELIEGFSKAFKINNDLVLVIVGDGPLYGVIVEKIKRSGLPDDAVKILSGISNPSKLYGISSLHCHISFGDTFGLVVLESLSHGVNTLINDFGDFKKIGPVDGLNFTEPSGDHIASNILRIIESPELVDVEKLQATFSWAVTARLLSGRSVSVS